MLTWREADGPQGSPHGKPQVPPPQCLLNFPWAFSIRLWAPPPPGLGKDRARFFSVLFTPRCTQRGLNRCLYNEHVSQRMTSPVSLGSSLPFWGLLLTSVNRCRRVSSAPASSSAPYGWRPHSLWPWAPGIFLCKERLSDKCWKRRQRSGPKRMGVKQGCFQVWSLSSGMTGANCRGTEAGACNLLAPNQMEWGWPQETRDLEAGRGPATGFSLVCMSL